MMFASKNSLLLQLLAETTLQKKITMYHINVSSWGLSSAGRASALHAEGQEFESPSLHHKIQDDICCSVFYFEHLL